LQNQASIIVPSNLVARLWTRSNPRRHVIFNGVKSTLPRLGLAFLMAVLASPCFAFRTITAPPNAFRVPVLILSMAPRTFGFVVHIQVNLANVSNVQQTGTLTLLPGSFSYARCVKSTTVHSFSNTFILQGSNCSKSSTYQTTGFDNAFLDSAKEVSFFLSPKGNIVLDVAVWLKGAIPFDSGPNGCEGQVDTQFSPLLELKVNEDRGAILGSLTPLVDADNCPGQSVCGYDTTAICASPIQPVNFVSVPLLINGGRPF
jgi:hypothetical protein